MMETLKKIHARLIKIEKSLNKIIKSEDFDFNTDELDNYEDTINISFKQLEDRENFLLKLNVRDASTKKELIDTANCISLCDRVWHLLLSISNENFRTNSEEEETMSEREVWEMMFPNEDVNSDDFEVGDYDDR